MKKRQWSIIAGIALLVISFFIFKYFSQTEEKKQKPRTVEAKMVQVMRVQNDSVAVLIPLDGPVQALDKIELFAEVSGVLENGQRRFDEGVAFARGETILRLNDRELRNTYNAQLQQYRALLAQILPDIKLDFPKALPTWKNYVKKVDQNIPPQAPPAVKSERLKAFLTNRNVYGTYNNLESTYARLDKFTLQAPFSGVVTSALVKPGALVRAGQPIGEFAGKGQFEFMPSVTLREAGLIGIGDTVKVHLPKGHRPHTGIVYRIGEQLDPATQRIKVFIRLQGTDFTDGQYATGELKTQPIARAFKLPRKLMYDKNATYIIKDQKLQKKTLEIVYKGRDYVVVENLPEGAVLPRTPVAGAYEGMPVQIMEN